MMIKKKMLVWETLATVSGGQKMTLTILDMLSGQYEFCCLIPAEGVLSGELRKRNIPYVLMGDQTLPTGVKGKKVIFRYGWMSVKNMWKSLKVIRTFQPDILYAPGPASLPWSAVCGSLTGKPVVWHLHHIFLDGATKKLLNICSGWKSVRAIIAVSNCVGKQIQNNKGKEKIKVLYNPVDVDKYANGDAARVTAEIEERLGCKLKNGDKKSVVIGHVALIQQSKRQDFVLEVISELKNWGYDVIGLFVGETREQDFIENLKRKVEERKLEKQVLFMGRRSDIPDLLQMMDVLMIPSSFEGFPLIGLEAASAGIPVAACDVAGAKEFIEVSGNGKVFTENNVKDAVEAVIDILQNRETLSVKGKSFAKKRTDNIYENNVRNVFDKSI